jgi:hypothetical protein
MKQRLSDLTGVAIDDEAGDIAENGRRKRGRRRFGGGVVTRERRAPPSV